jgi:hypothetical protein
MKISLRQLASCNSIEKIVIESVDLSLYIARAVIDSREYLVTDASGCPLKTRNLVEMKQQLSGLDIQQLRLLQRSAYDEMVGQPQRECDNALEVGLSAEAYPTPPWQH